MLPGWRNEGMVQNVCRELPLVFTFLLLVTGLLPIVDMVLLGGILAKVLANIVQFTIFNFQVWRLLTSVLACGSLLNQLFALLGCYFIMAPFEKKYSTPLMFLDMFLQTLQIEVVVCLVSVILYQFDTPMLVSFGLWKLWMIHVCRFCFEDPEGAIRLPCLPCQIQKKYYPAFIAMIFIVFFGEGLPFIISCVIGHIQAIYFKGYIFRLSLGCLKLFETFTPKCIRDRHDYYSLVKCPDVTSACKIGFGESAAPPAPAQQANVGPGFLFSNGVQVGGGQPVTVDDVRDHWANKDNQEGPSGDGLMEVGSMVSQGSNQDKDLIPKK